MSASTRNNSSTSLIWLRENENQLSTRWASRRPPKIFAKNFLIAAITATTATTTSLNPFLSSTTSHVNNPNLAAPTAVAPTTSAASPNLATLSPLRYSEYVWPVWKE